MVTQLDQAVPRFEAAAIAALADITAAAPLADEAVVAAFNKDAASFYALFEDIGLAVTAPAATSLNPFAALTKHATTVVYMTGTPIQNQPSDMLNLIRPLQPDLCATLEAGPKFYEETAFKRLIAPVYLRRNHNDVLKELPPIEQQDVWLGMSAQERARFDQGSRNCLPKIVRQRDTVLTSC